MLVQLTAGNVAHHTAAAAAPTAAAAAADDDDDDNREKQRYRSALTGVKLVNGLTCDRLHQGFSTQCISDDNRSSQYSANVEELPYRLRWWTFPNDLYTARA